MTERRHTFCRICEPNCPLVADIDDLGRVVHLSPNFDHPCKGIACHKGLSFLEVHNDPDRLDWPQRRRNPRTEARGDFVNVEWDDAATDIGDRIRAIRDKYGPASVAMYFGNPAAFNSAALLFATEFQDLLDTPMRFSANTQDAANKFIAMSAIYGSADSFTIPDILQTDYLLCIGANPKVSRWTLMSAPNNWDAVKNIRKRGGKIRFVNPRITESSTEETGPTIVIRPGTDVYFLAALLHEIDIRHGFDDGLIEKHTRNVASLRRFVARYPAEHVAGVTGIDPRVIRDVADELVAAKSAATYMSTGVNQSRQGVLCSWLVEMLQVVTGNLGRPGGNFRPFGLIEHFSPAANVQRIETSIGAFELPDPIGYSAMPAAVLPDLIEAGDIRALIVLAGNPLLSIGGGERARLAYQKLDLLVTIDIYRSATGEMADYVLPAADWLERPDINLLGSGMQLVPYVQHSDAMVEPAGGRRNEWWILARLAQAVGLPSPLDRTPDERHATEAVNALLAGQGFSIEAMRNAPSRSVLLPQGDRNSIFERILKHPDGKIDCCPSSFADSGLLTRCEDIFRELAEEAPDTLKLISLRTTQLHNSWLANSVRYRRGQHAENPLHLSEADAHRLGLFAGDLVRVSTHSGTVEARVLIDDSLGIGTVAMSHGFGHDRSFGLRVASRNPGANCNGLMPTGRDSYEPVSYMSWLSGVPVTIERIAAS